MEIDAQSQVNVCVSSQNNLTAVMISHNGSRRLTYLSGATILMKFIQGTTLTVSQVTAISRRTEGRVNLDEKAARQRITANGNWVADNISRGTDTYGVTTGFGATSHRPTNRTVDLQTELIRFLNAGVIGSDSLPTCYSKAAMLVRTNTLMQRYSRIRREIFYAMAQLMNLSLIPKLPLS